MALQKSPLISLGDLLEVVWELLNPDGSRPGLDRCLRRHRCSIPQSVLARSSPLQEIKYWLKLSPELFKKQAY